MRIFGIILAFAPLIWWLIAYYTDGTFDDFDKPREYLTICICLTVWALTCAFLIWKG